MKKRKRSIRKTLLAVGEGDTEVAFLKHIKGLYCSDGLGVSLSIRNAHGKGPENVINHTIQCQHLASYDKKLCLLDTDLPWSQEIIRSAEKYNINLVGSTPCIEGLLLSILNQTISNLSNACKKKLQQFTKQDMTEVGHYQNYFSKEILEANRMKVDALDQLLTIIEDIS